MSQDVRKMLNHENKVATGKRGIHGKTELHAPDIHKPDHHPIFKDPCSNDEDGKMDKRRLCPQGKEFYNSQGTKLAAIETEDSNLRNKGLSQHHHDERTSKPVRNAEDSKEEDSSNCNEKVSKKDEIIEDNDVPDIERVQCTSRKDKAY